MEDMTKVMEKIRKLLALAKSANEHEAALAAERAQALLARHNLDLAQVERRDAMIEVDGEIVTDSYPWRRNIAAPLAMLYFCKYFYTPFIQGQNKTRYDRHAFVGEKHNIEVAKLMFKYLYKRVNDLALEGARDLPENQRSPYRVSFRNACSLRLHLRLLRRRAEAKKAMANPNALLSDQTINLPALADLYESTEFTLNQFTSSMDLTVKDVKVDKRHEQGWADGDKAGEKIGLDQQVDKNTTARLT